MRAGDDHPGWKSRFGQMVSSLSGSLSAALDASRPHPSAFVVGPGLKLKWNMEREGSEVSAEFHIKRRALYTINILFHLTTERAMELSALTGGSSMVLVRREEQDSDHPTVVADPHGPEAMQRKRSGECVWVPARGGVMIPVHLKVERLARRADPMVVLDRDFKTRGASGGRRKISFVVLRRGNYRLTGRTLAPTAVPTNVETYLSLGFRMMVM